MPINNIQVPQNVSEITAGWLAAALNSLIATEILSPINKIQIGEEFGFASKIYRVSWQTRKKKQSVVIKLWGLDKAGDREVLFYQSFPKCGTRVPKCYFGKVDYKSGHGILALENLVDVSQGDVLKRLNLAQGIELAKNLAGLHSKWIDNSKLTELDWITQQLAWFRTFEWFKSRHELFLMRFSDRLEGLPRQLLDRLDQAPTMANQRLRNSLPTLLHGDFHLDNIVFEQTNKPVILDWSRPISGPAAINLGALLFEMIDLSNFDKTQAAYIEEYNRLAQNPIDKEGLNFELGGALLMRFETATYGIAKWEPELPRAIQIIEDGIEHAATAIEFWNDREPALFEFLFEKT